MRTQKPYPISITHSSDGGGSGEGPRAHAQALPKLSLIQRLLFIPRLLYIGLSLAFIPKIVNNFRITLFIIIIHRHAPIRWALLCRVHPYCAPPRLVELPSSDFKSRSLQLKIIHLSVSLSARQSTESSPPKGRMTARMGQTIDCNRHRQLHTASRHTENRIPSSSSFSHHIHRRS